MGLDMSSINGFSLPTLEDIEHGIRSAYGEKMGNQFRNVVNNEIKERLRKGKSVKTTSFRGMRKRQRESREPLYNGPEVAKMLGTSRAIISKYRNWLGWDILLTNDNVIKLRDVIRENREIKGNNRNDERERIFNEVQVYPLVS